MSTVVIHDGAIHPGGAVKVVLEASRALDADLIIGVSGMNQDWWESRAPNDVRILSSNSKMGTFQDMRNALRMLKLSLQDYSTVVTSGPATKFFQPYDQQIHIHYLHHPPLSKLWYDGGLFAYLQGFIDRVETTSVPIIVANSELTADRYWKHYGERVEHVINPPVDTESFSWQGEHNPGKFVMVGRLEERKRPLLAVEAFEELVDSAQQTPELHLVGDGPLHDRIRKEAPENVVLRGYLDDEELQDLLESSYAGVFLAQREDFGITPIEYMAAGLPVLGVDEPNTNNQVEEDVTGCLVDPEPSAVAEGVSEMMERTWGRESIAKSAQKYGVDRFRSEIHEVVKNV